MTIVDVSGLAIGLFGESWEQIRPIIYQGFLLFGTICAILFVIMLVKAIAAYRANRGVDVLSVVGPLIGAIILYSAPSLLGLI